MIQRRHTRKIQVGKVAVGGDAPISVQSMTKTDTRDVAATVAQIHELQAIGCDINPVSTFLVRQAFTPASEAELRAAFERLERDVAPEIQRYYQTRDPKTGELIQVLYYFWVKTVTTPEGEVIPLLSRYVFSQDAYPKKKPRAQIVCPGCWGVLEDRYDATDLHCQHCGHEFNPQEGAAAGQ